MKVKIIIKTQPGNAKAIEKKVKFILMPRKLYHKVETTDKDNKIIWHVSDDPRKIRQLMKRVSIWDTMITQILSNKRMRNFADKRLTDGSVKDLEDMLYKHTSVELIHQKK